MATDSSDFRKPFLVKWLSVEPHWLLVVQQMVLSTAHNIDRPFTIYSDLLLCLTPLPKLYSHKKIRGLTSVACFLLYLSFCLSWSSSHPGLLVSILYLGHSVCPVLITMALPGDLSQSALGSGCLGKHTVCCPVVRDM